MRPFPKLSRAERRERAATLAALPGPIVAALRKLIDAAVSEGRDNWDSYYGHDNELHIAAVLESDAYVDAARVIIGSGSDGTQRSA